MQFSSTAALLAAAIIGNVAAYPQLAEKLSVKRQDDHAWQAPGPADARTACPGCNTLANHGYINRDGRGVSAQQLQQGFLDAFGFDFAVTAAGAQNAVNLQNNGQGTFDLDTLSQPHIIEHDGSLLSNDLQMSWNANADNHDFNATVWCQTQEFYGGGDHVDVVAANTARLGRNQQSQEEDVPGWFRENDGGPLAEAGFYLTTMDDPAVDGVSARLDWLNYWFTNQRLPTELGWVKPAINNDLFNAVVASVSAAVPTVPAVTGRCGLQSTSTPSATSTPVDTSSAPAYNPTYPASVTPSSYPSAPPYANSSTPIGTPSATPTGTPISYSSVTETSIDTHNPTATPTGNDKKPGANTTPVPAAPSATDVPAAVSSSARAAATGLAGPAPALPNAYKTVLDKNAWNQVSVVVTTYITRIEQIVVSLCSLQAIGAMPMPGSDSPSNGAGWYNPAPSGSSQPYSPAGSFNPAATCACK